ncbi:MAG TPA: tyrosine-type recombinase/integrase [Methanoregulaceae archaeon]|nr:tyrosine-type recombinase/integrase [Burkholderiaceae bacterium]NLH25276.1 tyrosine-type recombinase/integrase [Methanomicrobiales archaeon]HNI41528.1 tyrosine-type recombinase/integrase [Methanoregulaceae archaeon]HNJ81039.1 tyrosine-type recombinase/integrase [Methanoregulaceae archaeon]HNL86232.1 tyrosine-type recombinase/integrase [Methanoregulaceae archaeon]
MDGGYFSEWLVSYRHYLRMRNYSPRTIQSYEQVVRHFASYVWLRRNNPEKIELFWEDFSKARLDTTVEVKPVLITDYFTFINTRKPYKAKTTHRIISTLSSFYRFLYSQGVITANPMVAIERPKIKDQELRYLKHSQVLRLIASIEDDRDRLIVRTIYATGVRVSELCGINIEDIDFEDEMIKVRGKGGKIRIVFIDHETLEEISRFIGNRIEGPLFLGQMGHHISPRSVQHIFKKYAPQGITPHKIRHSYASELYRRSKNLRVVQENLGHTSIKTTEIYLHTDLDERRKVYQEFFPLSEHPAPKPAKKEEEPGEGPA